MGCLINLIARIRELFLLDKLNSFFQNDLQKLTKMKKPIKLLTTKAITWTMPESMVGIQQLQVDQEAETQKVGRYMIQQPLIKV